MPSYHNESSLDHLIGLNEDAAAKIAISSGPGRKVGAQGPRKDIASLSTNKNTVRARKRLQDMDPLQAEIERARNSESSALSTARMKLRNTTGWMVADGATRARLEVQAKEVKLAAL